jgi:hypothetical protein
MRRPLNRVRRTALWTRGVVAALLLPVIATVALFAWFSATRHLSPAELIRVGSKAAKIDWPWLDMLVAPAGLPGFPRAEDWPMQGAHPRSFQYQTYSATGFPEVGVTGAFMPPRGSGEDLIVGDVPTLHSALAHARPGDRVILRPGTYRVTGHNLQLRQDGRPDAPIFVRADRLGEVHLELDTLEGFYVNRAFWVFENLDIRGTCSTDSRCEHAFHVVGNAHGFVLRNNRLIDFNAAVKVNGVPNRDGIDTPDRGLIEFNTIYNVLPRDTSNPVTLLNIDNGNAWVVRSNFIADFAKAGGDHISYGAFMKGNSSDGVFERNLVLCYWRQAPVGGIRIGLSFGGGGTGSRFCRDGTCAIEHSGGIMRNNVILRCPDDVGIYLNRAANTLLYHNLLVGTRGIDVRFPTSTARIVNNIIPNGVSERDGGKALLSNNLVSPAYPWWRCWWGDCTIDDWFAAPLAGDLRLMSPSRVRGLGRSSTIVVDDFCGNPRPAQPALGPIEFSFGANCLPPHH